MKAIEFQTTIKNGTIEIPMRYRDSFKDSVRVILLADEPLTHEGDLIDQLLATPIRLPGFHPLSRDEANAR